MASDGRLPGRSALKASNAIWRLRPLTTGCLHTGSGREPTAREACCLGLRDALDGVGSAGRVHAESPGRHANGEPGSRPVQLNAGDAIAEESPPTSGARHSPARSHARGGSAAARPRRTLRNLAFCACRVCAPARRPHLRGAVLAAPPGVVVRVPVESQRCWRRVAGPVPVPAVDVRAHAVRPPVDLRPGGVRVGSSLAGEA